MKNYLPTSDGEAAYRVIYAIHRIQEQTLTQDEPAEFLGVIMLAPVDSHSLLLPEEFTLPASAATTTLTIELSYSLLPKAWGKGYATEALSAVFEACRVSPAFWAPFKKVYVRAVVEDENIASRKVLEKVAMADRGIYLWTGEAIFVGGKWRDVGHLHIYGLHLLETENKTP